MNKYLTLYLLKNQNMIQHNNYYFPVFALLVSLLFFSCTHQESKEAEQFFVQDDKNSDLDSLSKIQQELKKEPENIQLWIKKGKLCKDHLNFKCALDAGAKAYMLDSTNIEARRLYAWSLINKPNAPIADIERAKNHFKYILSIQPKDPETLVDLANTYSLTGDFKTAMKYINDALRIDKHYRDGYVLKGSIYKTIGNNDLALSSYQTALQIDPDYFIGQLNTGWLLTKMGNHKLALEYYQNAADLKPKNLNALYGIAKSQQDLETYDEALKEYRKINQVDSLFYISYFNQGFIKQYYQNELDSATYFFKKVLEINPKYKRAWYQLGENYLEKGEKSDAASAFGKALKIDPNFKPARDAADKLRKDLYK